MSQRAGSYERRDINEGQNSSIFSKLCYKVEQSVVAEFMSDECFNSAFQIAFIDMNELLSARNVSQDTIWALDDLFHISHDYANQLGFTVYQFP